MKIHELVSLKMRFAFNATMIGRLVLISRIRWSVIFNLSQCKLRVNYPIVWKSPLVSLVEPLKSEWFQIMDLIKSPQRKFQYFISESSLLYNRDLKSFIRFTECKVVDSTNTHELYIIHSFENDSACFDNSRLNVAQTEFFPNAAFDMRTFRFMIDGQETESQQQTILCRVIHSKSNEIE